LIDAQATNASSTPTLLVQLDSGPPLPPGERQQEALSLAHKRRRPAIRAKRVACAACRDARHG